MPRGLRLRAPSASDLGERRNRWQRNRWFSRQFGGYNRAHGNLTRLPVPIMENWEWQYDGVCRQVDPEVFCPTH